METPPAIPPVKPPLGTRFFVLLFTPLALFAVCFLIRDFAELIGSVVPVSAAVSFVCSILLARQLSRRISQTGEGTAGMSILLFVALQGFYFVCFFVGCTTAFVIA